MMAAARLRRGLEGFCKDYIDLGTAVARCRLYSLLHRKNIYPVVWALSGLVCPMWLRSSLLDTLDGGCKTQQAQQTMLTLFEGPSNHQL